MLELSTYHFEALICASSISSLRAAKPSSMRPMNKTNCKVPPAGIPSKAASPDLIDEKGTPYAMSPGSLTPADVTRWPRIANMEILPCLVSTVLSLSNLSWSASLRSPNGSQKPSGG